MGRKRKETGIPRKVRMECEGAVYHVMSRGNKRGSIFESDDDRKVFLLMLGEACERSGAVVYSYVLMGNHYHLLLGTPQGNLVATMQWMQSTYTARFNARHRQRGHVFAGRYKAIPIQEDDPTYGRIVSDHIHLNPAKARLVCREGQPNLKDYPWSSFLGLCGFAKLPGWVDERAYWVSIIGRSDAREIVLRIVNIWTALPWRERTRGI